MRRYPANSSMVSMEGGNSAKAAREQTASYRGSAARHVALVEAAVWAPRMHATASPRARLRTVSMKRWP